MASRPDLEILNVTKDLQSAAGEKFSELFNVALNGRNKLPPGRSFEIPVEGDGYFLECKWMIFIICNQWDGPNGSSVMTLRNGICDFLEKCNSNNVESVTMSAIGTGLILKYPSEVTATIIGEEIQNFVQRHSNTRVKKIQLVVKQLPENEMVFISYRETLLAMDLGEQIILCNEAGACFHKIPIGQYTEKNAGHVSVSVVYGNIVNESTNAIVNSTDFIQWKKDSVAYSIFSAAGAEVVKDAQDGRNDGNKVVMTKAGHLKCTWILHCNCEGKLDNINEIVKSILEKCNNVGLKSVAIPAIGTGECGLRPEHVANRIMKAISSVARDHKLRCTTTVRLVTSSPCIYHIF